MNDAQTLKLAARRAALHSAIRSGDAITAARAAARLRVPLAELTVAELRRAREARRTLGRAIVKARLPRREEQPLVTGIAIPPPLPGSRRRAIIAALAALALLLLLIGGGAPKGAPGAPDEAAVELQQQQTQDQLLVVSRGRTIALPPVLAVAASATPAPTATATPAPQPTSAVATATAQGTARRTATPGPTGAGGGSGGTGATGTGGGGSGGGSGSGSGGAGGGSGSGTGFPTPAPLPPVPPPGFGRFQIIVLDQFTNRPIPGACVIIGTQSCDPSQPHTDANGRWAVDVPATTLTTYWDLYFSKPGYIFALRQFGLAAGQTANYTVFLRRSF